MYTDAFTAILTGPTADDVETIVRTAADKRHLAQSAELSTVALQLLREFGTNVLVPKLIEETGYTIVFGDEYPLAENKGDTRTGWSVIAMAYCDSMGYGENSRQLENIAAFFETCIPNR